MSRTKKDKPNKFKYPDWLDWYDSTGLMKKPKRKKEVDTEWHWMTTPSWWVNLFMTRPQRRAAQQWERNVGKYDLKFLDDLEDVDKPNISKKPHKYYW